MVDQESKGQTRQATGTVRHFQFDHQIRHSTGSMDSKTQRTTWRPPSLVQPVIGGAFLFFIFNSLAVNGPLQSPLVQRYMVGHVINRMTTALFFVGVAALLLAAWDVYRQRSTLGRVNLRDRKSPVTGGKAVSATDEPASPDSDRELATTLLDGLKSFGTRVRHQYIFQRLEKVLLAIGRDGAGAAINDRLRTLAEGDGDRQSQRYGLPRILVWATPLLGFLGTVLGISEAMGSLSVGAESDLQAMMGGLQTNLNMAFDTTAQALVLSIMLMFAVFATERQETLLLEEVTARTEEEIGKWFVLTDKTEETKPLEINAVLNQQVRELLAQVAERATAAWDKAAEQQFAKLAVQPTTSRRIESALVGLTTALGELQRQLNLQRERDDASPRILSMNRPSDNDRKAA